MFVAVLMTAPAQPVLDPATVTAVRNAWGGGDIRWLAPGIAAEFTVPFMPDTRWEVWDDLQKMKVDLCVVPAENRRKAMLIADMDSTMIEQECIDELAEVAQVGERVRAITARAMNGELDFEGALTERVALLTGLETRVIRQVLAERITEAAGGRTLLATMKASGAYTLLVSGGFTAFSEVIAGKIGFHDHQANTLEADGARLTGRVVPPILGRQAKIEALEAAVAARDLVEDDVIAVGDGANDLGMLGRAGMGVALHAKPAVAAACDLRINHADLTGLLYLQGYTQQDFTAG